MNQLELKDKIVTELIRICKLSPRCILPAVGDESEMEEKQEKYFKLLTGNGVTFDDLIPIAVAADDILYGCVTISVVLYKDSNDRDMVNVIIINDGFMEVDFTSEEWAVVLRNLNLVTQYKNMVTAKEEMRNDKETL